MDIKKLSFFIIIIGLVVFAWGGIQYLNNQPKKFDTAESGQNVFGGRDDLGNWMNVQEENYGRKQKRESANTIMIIGGIIAVIGGVIRTTIKPENTNSNPNSSQQNEFYYCTNCGTKVLKGNQCSNCNTY
jgi:hypothetical protein